MRTDARDPQLLKGVLPMLVLALLAERESYGYELVNRLAADGLSDVATGTIYPVLTRLERDGLITSRLVASSAGPARKYYRATGPGEAELAESARSWRVLTAAVAATLARSAAPAPAPPATDPSSTRPEELA